MEFRNYRQFIVIVCIQFFVICFVQAQNNLIPNPNFEIKYRCPGHHFSASDMIIDSFASNWESVFFKYWADCNGQYFHECANLPGGGGPGSTNNFYKGNPKTYNGNAYAGICVSVSIWGIKNNPGNSIRQFLGTQLNKPVLPNHNYRISYNIYSSDSNYITLNNFGACLFKEKTFINPVNGRDSNGNEIWEYSKYKPVFESKEIIKSGYWNTISGEFKADAELSYLVLGNFSNYPNMEQVPIRFPLENFRGHVSTFFIDDVSLIDITKQIGNKRNYVCINDTLTLWPENLTKKHYWSNSSVGADTLSLLDTLSLRISKFTKIYLFEDSTGLVDSCLIDVIDNTIKVLPTDTFFCEQDDITISPIIPGSSYLWSTGSTTKELKVRDAGNYKLQLNLWGCLINDSVLVTSCPSSIFFPNSFTPNGDGLNDYFVPVFQQIDGFEMSIYDRWGVLLFTSDNPRIGWNGMSSSGNDLPSDVYFFKAIVMQNKQKLSFKGNITLLR
ncbi:MAG: gliding motility-associated C-terminal domain-containing protein [Bacteroidota bacterium]|nr:gliding motility-associated C-terminal domain-containing protein [Bacteroidota bacterium]